jgi:hypothetical protein
VRWLVATSGLSSLDHFYFSARGPPAPDAAT